MPVADSTGRDSEAHPTTAWTLIGVVATFAVANSVISFITTDTQPESMIRDAIAYALVVLEPIMFGIWTALGYGSIFKRLFITIPCLLLLSLVPGYIPDAFSDVTRSEFIMMMLVGFAIYATAIGVFFVFHKFTGFRILQIGDGSMTSEPTLRFSIRDLIAITTLWAVVLGLTVQLKFQTIVEQSTLLFGPNLFMEVLIYGSASLSLWALPTLAIPLFILHGKPGRLAVLITVLCWVTVAMTMVALQNTPGHFFETVGVVLGFQMVATAIGAAVATLLRYGGFRLTRPVRTTKVEVSDAPV
jgi:hypothetical protein